MGEPSATHLAEPRPQSNKGGELTRRSETSQYPQEQKSNEIALVAASERARAQILVA